MLAIDDPSAYDEVLPSRHPKLELMYLMIPTLREHHQTKSKILWLEFNYFNALYMVIRKIVRQYILRNATQFTNNYYFFYKTPFMTLTCSE